MPRPRIAIPRMTLAEQVELWDAVNAYAEARGANMARTDVPIQRAVVEVNEAVERIRLRAAARRGRT